MSAFALTAGSVVIGRSKTCDLQLDDPDVSRKHASIREENGHYHISDAGSRNGVLLQGRRIEKETELKAGDEITLGPFVLTFHLDAADGASGESEPATRFVSAQDIQNDLPGRKVSKKTPSRLCVKLAVLDGPLKGGVFEDWSGDLTIGRSLDNHVVLLDDAVTSYHARIFEKPDGYYLEDLGSHNGTFVQGVKVTSIKLGTSAKIRIGITTLQFKIVDKVQRKKLILRSVIASMAVLLLLFVAKAMMPDDQAGPLTQQGKSLFRARNFEEAKKTYERVLADYPDYAPAREALKEVKAFIEADVAIARAVKAAEEARFNDALGIMETALRMAPAYRGAARMKERIKAMSEAEVAYEARNWTDAVRLFKSIAAEYPSSRIVSQRWASASAELVAAESLAAAQDHVQRGQLELARKALAGIPAQSVSHAAAAQMQAAIQWMEGVNRQLAADDALPLRQTFALLQKEQDPLKALNLSAEDLKGRIALRLKAISQKLTLEAKEKVRVGQRAEGFRLYERALEADPTNAEATAAAASIRAVIRKECAGYLAEVKRYESLGQRQRVAETLKKILAAGIPGEDYYDFAKNKLAGMKP
ncbi:MAG: hypothetical protein A2X46_14800 [Lentisphaerae bacterium GWF2_57_35]|nr:MAG: hypothetical protein A2X46_14800 [Lentisphaerae bacterium GWF2_57_35]